MTASVGGLCRHCLLPVGVRALQQTVNGESCAFCCYGCSIAFQVKNGKSEEWEAAWLLIRLGVGGFLSMNIMLFSLLIYGGVFTGADARVLPVIDVLLLILATPAVIILGGPFLRETVVEGGRGRLTSSGLIVVGVAAAYVYSAVAVAERNTQVYFDTATMVLMLFTLGRYLEAAGRARAARDLEPLLAVDRENVRVVENDGAETLCPVRRVETGTLVRVRPGERIAVDGVIVEGASHADEMVITGESRPVEKGIGSAVISGSVNIEGSLLIRSSGSGTATRWAQICRSVRDALIRRSPIHRLADRAVAVAVPAVFILGRPHRDLLGAVAVARSRHVDGRCGSRGSLPVRGRSRRTAGNIARHRASGAPWLPSPRRRRARSSGAGAAAGFRQDRHVDDRKGPSRRHRNRWRRGY